MTPEEALRRANEAGRLFNDPTLKEALDVMERDVVEAWIACPVRDVEGKEELNRLIKTTRKFRDLLRGTMESGKLAAEQIRQKQESLAQRAASAVRQFRR
jgi:hypothetical protein